MEHNRVLAGVVQTSRAAEKVASALGVIGHTVRAQIKHICAKTSVDSRARLVKLVCALASA